MLLETIMSLKIKKHEVDAQIPVSADKGSAGIDLYSYETGIIEPRSHAMIDTKISMEIPENYCGLIWPRSGLSAKYGIETGAGVIDSTYRGVIKVILHNHSDKPFQYEKGMRIAQMIITPYLAPKIVMLDNNEQHTESDRGDGGFGSTGLY